MTYTVFLEVAPPDSPLSSLPSFDKDQVYIYVHNFRKYSVVASKKSQVLNFWLQIYFFFKSGCDAIFQIL